MAEASGGRCPHQPSHLPTCHGWFWRRKFLLQTLSECCRIEGFSSKVVHLMAVWLKKLFIRLSYNILTATDRWFFINQNFNTSFFPKKKWIADVVIKLSRIVQVTNIVSKTRFICSNKVAILYFIMGLNLTKHIRLGENQELACWNERRNIQFTKSNCNLVFA